MWQQKCDYNTVKNEWLVNNKRKITEPGCGNSENKFISYNELGTFLNFRYM